MRKTLVASLLVVSGLGIGLWARGVQRIDAFDGRPTFKEGSDRSYFVWRDGERWHLRWTTMGVERTFSGTIRATGGAVADLKRIDVDEELKVIRPGRPARVVRGPRGRAVGVAPGRPRVVAEKTDDHITRVDDHLIRWDTKTNDDIDGFDFTAKDVASLTFDLKISGDAKPLGVEVGQHNVHPPDNPFTVRVR
jgi:hypothetical protein